MSEIRTNILISGESSEYRSNIEISIVTLNSALVDTHSSFRTNLDITTTLKDGSISAIKTNLELNNVALKFYLVDMTKLNQSLLYFSKFFNMYFEPEVMWDLLAQGTNEQINISHLSDALSDYITKDYLTSINNTIVNINNALTNHLQDNIRHLTQKEKDFLVGLMSNIPTGSGDSLFELTSVEIGNGIYAYAVRPLLFESKQVGIISNSFISCKGVDATSSSVGGITRGDLFNILSGEPLDSSEIINSKFLNIENLLEPYAKQDWVNNNFIKEEKDPTVPQHVKKITTDQISSWDFVASLFNVNDANTYVYVTDNRGFVSNSFISCKGVDISAPESGGSFTRNDIFNILSSEPLSGEFINLEFLDLDDYALRDWVNNTFALSTSLDSYLLKTTYNSFISQYDETIENINSSVNKKADKTLNIIAGNGIIGGGNLESDRTITLGTPSTITSISKNEVTEESHTHKIDKASTSTTGIVKLYDALDSESTILALTANQGRLLHLRIVSLEDMWEDKTTYLLAKNNRGIVSNSFITCRGLDETAPQVGGTFDRGSLFDILSGEPQNGESINLGYLDLSTYATIDFVISQGYITSNALSSYATQQWVLNKGYATTSDLDTRINNLINGAPAAYDTLKEIADVLTGNVDSIGDILTVLGNKADKATTLAGYGITDALSSTTKYALGDDVGGNAVNANKLGNQLPAYYATADGLTGVSNRVKTFEDIIGIDDNGDVYIKKNGETARNFYTYGAITFGGVGTNGGNVSGATSLSGLTDVALGILSDGQVLTYDNGKWVNKTISISGGGLDVTAMWNALATVDNTKVIDSSHIPDLSGKYAVYNTHIDTNNLSNSTNHMGYGYATEGWAESGPAISFGVTDYQFQMQMSLAADASFVRWRPIQTANRFSWRRFIDTYNYSSYCLPISGGTVNGMLTVKRDATVPLYVHTSVDTGLSLIRFKINSVNRASIGAHRDNEYLYRSNPDLTSYYKIYDEGSLTKLSQLTDDVVSGNYLSLSGGTMSQNSKIKWANNVQSWDDLDNGFTAISTARDNDYYAGLSFKGWYGFQIRAYGGDTDLIQARGATNEAWGTWRTLIHSGNIGSQSVSYASSADAASYLTAKNPNLAANTRGDLNYTYSLYTGGWGNSNKGYATQYGTYLDISGYSTWYHRLAFNTSGLIEHFAGINTTTLSKIGDIAYTWSNVASATKLATARTIWGQSFDGTGNVDGCLTLGGITTANTPHLKFGYNGEYFDLNGNFVLSAKSGSWNIFNQTNTNVLLRVVNNGNVLIGTTTDSGYKLNVNGSISANGSIYVRQSGAILGIDIGASRQPLRMFNFPEHDCVYFQINKADGSGTSGKLFITGHGGYNNYFSEMRVYAPLTVYGNFVATGAITFGSDARYKHRLDDVSISIEDIANAPLFNYVWTDREDKKVHLGTTAQYWNNTAFKNAVVSTNDEKLWTMSYSEIAVGGMITIARELIPIKREVSKVQRLEERVEKLERILTQHNIKFD